MSDFYKFTAMKTADDGGGMYPETYISKNREELEDVRQDRLDHPDYGFVGSIEEHDGTVIEVASRAQASGQIQHGVHAHDSDRVRDHDL